MDDLELLRPHELVVHLTEGEHFFPMAADTYIGRATSYSPRPEFAHT